MKIKILFIGHDANRAGAQLLLLWWQKLLLNEQNIEFETILKHDGSLKKDYESLGKVYLWPSNQPLPQKSRLKRALEIILPKDLDNELVEVLKFKKFDFIISNTLTNGDILPKIAQLKVPIISYVHELAMHLEMYTQKTDLQQALQLSSHFFVCAKVAAQSLVQNHQIEVSKTTWIPTPARPKENPQKPKEEVLTELSFYKNQPVIGCIGSVNLRKGIDFFVYLAETLPHYNFVWVGGNRIDFMEIINLNSFPNNLRFVPNTNDVWSYLTLFDLYVQTARVEVFPLSVMEAFSVKIPVICFEEAGGTKEIVGEDAGFVIPQLNINLMVEKIEFLLTNNSLKEKMGEVGYHKIMNDYRPENSVKLLINTLISLKVK